MFYEFLSHPRVHHTSGDKSTTTDNNNDNADKKSTINCTGDYDKDGGGCRVSTLTMTITGFMILRQEDHPLCHGDGGQWMMTIALLMAWVDDSIQPDMRISGKRGSDGGGG